MSCYYKETNMLYGGDYNPEQWGREVWEEDMRLMAQAHINIVTLNVFSWASLQPDEDTYDFARLDEIMQLVRANGMKYAWRLLRGRIRRGWQSGILISFGRKKTG